MTKEERWRMPRLHYSVRRSATRREKFKVVLAGGFWGCDDIDLPLFETFDEAASAAERLNRIKDKK
jgi:hypothetical protein